MRVPIDWIYICAFWDGPINGWIRVKQRLFHFQQYHENERGHRKYEICETDRETRREFVVNRRLWRNMVGWHQDRKPGLPRTYYDGASHPHTSLYYEISKRRFDHAAKHGRPEHRWKRRVGTTDLYSGFCIMNRRQLSRMERPWT